MALFVLYTVFAFSRKDKYIDFKKLSPEFVRYINERKHLQRELEIARKVQDSFLPASIPSIKGLDISAKCIPALEVGGDYYDFIYYSPQKIGLLIGDVSGKGTEAAFYMTLTKGFIKAVGQNSKSPEEILKSVNRLFNENAERRIFISMVFVLFDMESGKATIARAGHNFPLYYNGKDLKFIESKGIALGLDSGERFDKTIEEIEISFKNGDIIALYTDGLVEAINKKNEQFGDQRLLKIVEEHLSESALKLQETTLKTVKKFTAGRKQHDDISVLFIKKL